MTKSKQKLYETLGKFFTDKSAIINTHTYDFEDSDYKARKKSQYKGSKGETIDVNYKGYEIEAVTKKHIYDEDEYCPVFCDYQGTHTTSDRWTKLSICDKNDDSRENLLLLDGKDINDIKKKVFDELRNQRSLRTYLQNKGFMDCSSFWADNNSIKINGESYPITTGRLEMTKELDDIKYDKDKKKPLVDIARVIRTPKYNFWQSYDVSVRLVKSPSRFFNFEDRIKNKPLRDCLDEIIRDNENISCSKRYSENLGITGIYLDYKNIKTTKEADQLIDYIQEYQGKKQEIENKIKELKKFPYEELKKIV